MSRLKESLEKSNTMTKNMQDILQTFDSRLRKLEDTITPVYQETGNLQRRQESILGANECENQMIKTSVFKMMLFNYLMTCSVISG